MWLPARLERSTLGDLLGSLHRGRASGALELVEVDGSAAGALRAIHLVDGEVVRVDAPGPRIGERIVREPSGRVPVELALGSQPRAGHLAGHVLMAAGLVSARTLGDELAAQARERLERLFAMKRAQLRFRVARARGAASPAIALGPEVFLHGRPRRSPRLAAVPAGGVSPAPQAAGADRAFAHLGLAPGRASAEDIRRAFRRRAAALHPDRARDATSRQILERAFAQLGDAYRRALAAAAPTG